MGLPGVISPYVIVKIHEIPGMDPVVPPKKIREFSPQIVAFTCIQSSGSERIHREGSLQWFMK